MLKREQEIDTVDLPERANSFYEKVPDKISTWDRGWPVTMSMRKLKSARTKYFIKKYELALENINKHIKSNISDNPYSMSHEKALAPFLYYQAYQLKALCLIELHQWHDASSFITNALLAARMVFISKSQEIQELKDLRIICNKNELLNSQPTTTPAFSSFTKEELKKEETNCNEDSIATRVKKKRKTN
jgi:hypothetical protein